MEMATLDVETMKLVMHVLEDRGEENYSIVWLVKFAWIKPCVNAEDAESPGSSRSAKMQAKKLHTCMLIILLVLEGSVSGCLYGTSY